MKKRGICSLIGKKSQITLFIIIAIIIIAGAIAYITLTKQSFEGDPMEYAKQLTRSDSIRLYVESCLEDATQEAVLLAGRQGGYLYDTQYEGGIYLLGPGGKICGSFPPGACDAGANVVPYETTDGIIDPVSYLIKQNPSANMPYYPYLGYLRTKDQTDTFGAVAGGEKKGYPLELCDVGGPNARDTAGAKQTCFNSYSVIGKSIQSFMGSYIAEKVQECADFTGLAIAKGVEIDAENASAEVMFGETDLISTVHYKLNIRLTSKQSVTTIADYSYHMKDLRLKEIYELVYYLVKEDTTNIFFDMGSEEDLLSLASCMDPLNEGQRTICLKDGMSVSKIESPCAACPKNKYAEIIQVRDTFSSVEGEPYLFQFAVANRPPALDYVGSKVEDSTHYFRYLSSINKISPYIYGKRTLVAGDGDDYNIIIGEQDSLEIYPYGIDPDEDALAYRYVPLAGDSATSEKLEASDLFLATKRDAMVGPGALDIGKHYVRLTVADAEGFTDWQNITIMVCNTTQSDPLPEYACS